MLLTNQIKELSKNREKSIVESLDWFNTSLSNKDSNEVKSMTKIPYFKPGKIYKFVYIPENKDSLDFYDMKPLIISLGSKQYSENKVNLGLNLNYFPYKVRVYIITKIYQLYKLKIELQIKKYPFNAYAQKDIGITYEDLKTIFPTLNISFATRNYLRGNRSKISQISYENLYRVPFIEDYKFVKSNVVTIHSMYYKSLQK